MKKKLIYNPYVIIVFVLLVCGFIVAWMDYEINFQSDLKTSVALVEVLCVRDLNVILASCHIDSCFQVVGCMVNGEEKYFSVENGTCIRKPIPNAICA